MNKTIDVGMWKSIQSKAEELSLYYLSLNLSTTDKCVFHCPSSMHVLHIGVPVGTPMIISGTALRELELQGVCNSDIPSILEQCPNLTCFVGDDIQCSSTKKKDGNDRIVRVLHHGVSERRASPACLSSLERLSLSLVKDEWDLHVLDEISNSCPNIRELSLDPIRSQILLSQPASVDVAMRVLRHHGPTYHLFHPRRHQHQR